MTTTLQHQALKLMTNALRDLETKVPPPRKAPHKDGFVFRYVERTIYQALVQKLAQLISALNAAEVLLEHGFTQEVGVLLRTLDECQEDIFFLSIAVTENAFTDRHKQYLDAFYSDSVLMRPDGSLNIDKPNLVPRKKIRAYTLNTAGQGINISNALEASESLSSVYSGYVHGASANIMDMYGGNPPMFHISGMSGTPRIAGCLRTLSHAFYRSMSATIAIAKAFGTKSHVDAFDGVLKRYESVQPDSTQLHPYHDSMEKT